MYTPKGGSSTSVDERKEYFSEGSHLRGDGRHRASTHDQGAGAGLYGDGMVTAAMRNPLALPWRHERLRVVEADVMRPETLDAVVEVCTRVSDNLLPRAVVEVGGRDRHVATSS